MNDSIFKPFDHVLVRDDHRTEWRARHFESYITLSNGHVLYRVTGGQLYEQCIPYEGNEHLCGIMDKTEE